MKKTARSKKDTNAWVNTGLTLVALSPIVFFAVILFFSEFFCKQLNATYCNDIGLGIIRYAFFTAVSVTGVGILLLIVSSLKGVKTKRLAIPRLNNKKLTLLILTIVLAQMVLLNMLAANHWMARFSIDWPGLVVASWPLYPAAILIGYLVSSYKGVYDWIDKHKALTFMIVSLTLCALSVFLFVGTSVDYFWS